VRLDVREEGERGREERVGWPVDCNIAGGEGDEVGRLQEGGGAVEEAVQARGFLCVRGRLRGVECCPGEWIGVGGAGGQVGEAAAVQGQEVGIEEFVDGEEVEGEEEWATCEAIEVLEEGVAVEVGDLPVVVRDVSETPADFVVEPVARYCGVEAADLFGVEDAGLAIRHLWRGGRVVVAFISSVLEQVQALKDIWGITVLRVDIVLLCQLFGGVQILKNPETLPPSYSVKYLFIFYLVWAIQYTFVQFCFPAIECVKDCSRRRSVNRDTCTTRSKVVDKFTVQIQNIA